MMDSFGVGWIADTSAIGGDVGLSSLSEPYFIVTQKRK